ncbi:MAG: hypothetical protein ACKO3Q_10630 [Betaproteobacteria bacterium]
MLSLHGTLYPVKTSVCKACPQVIDHAEMPSSRRKTTLRHAKFLQIFNLSTAADKLLI